jgi:hypothetical protein
MFADFTGRAVLAIVSVSLLLLLQNFQAFIRRLTRSALDSYRYSGLLAFKAVWDEIGNKNERGKLRQYLIISIIIDCLISFSLFRRPGYNIAFIAAPAIALAAFAVELHLVLSWFYNSKPFPVERNRLFSVPSLALFSIFSILAGSSLGRFYYCSLPFFPGLRYAAILAIASGAVSGAVMFPGLFGHKKIKAGPAIVFYLIPAAMTVVMMNRSLFLKISRPPDIAVRMCFGAPEIILPVLSVIMVMIFNAAGSYLGHRLVRDAPPALNPAGQTGYSNPFMGRE